jgi:phage/plasmid-associated DNA primase
MRSAAKQNSHKRSNRTDGKRSKKHKQDVATVAETNDNVPRTVRERDPDADLVIRNVELSVIAKKLKTTTNCLEVVGNRVYQNMKSFLMVRVKQRNPDGTLAKNPDGTSVAKMERFTFDFMTCRCTRHGEQCTQPELVGWDAENECCHQCGASRSEKSKWSDGFMPTDHGFDCNATRYMRKTAAAMDESEDEGDRSTSTAEDAKKPHTREKIEQPFPNALAAQPETSPAYAWLPLDAFNTGTDPPMDKWWEKGWSNRHLRRMKWEEVGRSSRASEVTSPLVGEAATYEPGPSSKTRLFYRITRGCIALGGGGGDEPMAEALVECFGDRIRVTRESGQSSPTVYCWGGHTFVETDPVYPTRLVGIVGKYYQMAAEWIAYVARDGGPSDEEVFGKAMMVYDELTKTSQAMNHLGTRKNVSTMATASYIENVDCMTWNTVQNKCIPVRNGVLVLGEKNSDGTTRPPYLRAGRPSDLFNKRCGIVYQGDEAAAAAALCLPSVRESAWHTFLETTFASYEPDQTGPGTGKLRADNAQLLEEKLPFLQVYLGSMIVRVYNGRGFLVCVGQGMDGKSVCFEVLKQFFPLIDIVNKSLLFSNPHEASTAESASPHKMKLAGCRGAVINEWKSSFLADAAKIKEFGRKLHSNGSSKLGAAPRFILFCNEVFRFDDPDRAVFERLILWRFESQFAEPGNKTYSYATVLADEQKRLLPDGHPDKVLALPRVRQANKEIKDTLSVELPLILAWMVEGARRYLAEGMGTPPACVRESSERYQAEMDVYGRWLNQFTTRSDESVARARGLYELYVFIFNLHYPRPRTVEPGSEVAFCNYFKQRFTKKDMTGHAGVVYGGIRNTYERKLRAFCEQCVETVPPRDQTKQEASVREEVLESAFADYLQRTATTDDYVGSTEIFSSFLRSRKQGAASALKRSLLEDMEFFLYDDPRFNRAKSSGFRLKGAAAPVAAEAVTGGSIA